MRADRAVNHAISLPESLWAEVDRLAASRKTTRSAIIRAGVLALLERPQTVLPQAVVGPARAGRERKPSTGSVATVVPEQQAGRREVTPRFKTKTK